MARKIRNKNLETRTDRLRLAVTPRPVFVKISSGLALGYRRNQAGGTWIVRKADGKGGNWTKAIGRADDYQEANASADDFNDAAGRNVLTYWEAQLRARKVAEESGSTTKTTVREALAAYETHLKERGGDIGNVTRLRRHLSEELLKRRALGIDKSEWLAWRSTLLKATATVGTANRILVVARAALNLLSGGHDRAPWREGLASMTRNRDQEQDRNIVLTAGLVRRVMNVADAMDLQFGLFVAIMAQTGARPGQICKIKVGDLSTYDSSISIPVSKKGRGTKRKTHVHLSITDSLMTRLKPVAEGRDKGEPLLTKSRVRGKRIWVTPWRKSDQKRPFEKVIKVIADEPEFTEWLKREQLIPKQVTIYSLRHTSIVRQILANVPTRAVAAAHDTSLSMIEATYSRHIERHADPIMRKSLEYFD
jgi:integrase